MQRGVLRPQQRRERGQSTGERLRLLPWRLPTLPGMHQGRVGLASGEGRDPAAGGRTDRRTVPVASTQTVRVLVWRGVRSLLHPTCRSNSCYNPPQQAGLPVETLTAAMICLHRDISLKVGRSVWVVRSGMQEEQCTAGCPAGCSTASLAAPDRHSRACKTTWRVSDTVTIHVTDFQKQLTWRA